MNKKILSLLLAFGLLSLVYGKDNPENACKTYPYGISEFTPPALTKLNSENKVSRYRPSKRLFQGIVQIEQAQNGRLWAAWTASSFQGEKAPFFKDMYSVIATSTDDGDTWKEVFVYDPFWLLEGGASEPMLWKDKNGKIRLTISRVMTLDKNDPSRDRLNTTWEWTMNNPNNEDPNWSEPKFITRYNASIMKPTYLSNGTLIRPMDNFLDMKDQYKTRFLVVNANSEKELFTGEAKVENVGFSEQMVLERKNGTLISFVRTRDAGQRYITSRDKGKTWKDEGYFPQEFSVNTKASFVRLPSGEVLIVANDNQRKKDPETGKIIKGRVPRSNMTAFLSLDDAKTFPYKILLDDNLAVSYPSIAIGKNGFVYIGYDNGRGSYGKQELRFAKITVADIKAGKLVNPKSKLEQVISNLKEQGGGVKKGGEPL